MTNVFLDAVSLAARVTDPQRLPRTELADLPHYSDSPNTCFQTVLSAPVANTGTGAQAGQPTIRFVQDPTATRIRSRSSLTPLYQGTVRALPSPRRHPPSCAD